MNSGLSLQHRSAQTLYRLGFNVIPGNGKIACLPWTQYQRERVPATLMTEWAKNRFYSEEKNRYWSADPFNWLLLTGATSGGTGIVIVDADDDAGEALVAARCPKTPVMQRTPGGGWHRGYRHPGVYVPVRKKTVIGGTVYNVDIRGDGGYIVAPGGRSKGGGSYREVRPWTAELIAAAPVYDPAWLPDERPEREGRLEGDDEHERAVAACAVPIAERVRQFRRYTAECPGTEEGKGKGAEAYCYAMAMDAAWGFLLPKEEAVDELLAWGEKPDNTDAGGIYWPWKRKEITHKVADAIHSAPDEHPGWRVSWNYLGDAGERAQEKVKPAPETEQPGDLAAYKSDPMTAYLWKGHHGRRLTDEQRARRIKSIEETRSLMPASGFFPDYLRCFLPTSDCTPIFHLGAALALASTLVNRKVWMPWRFGRLPVLLWNALIAQSTLERKSTAINEVRDLLGSFGRAYLLPNSFSTEALFLHLGWQMNEGETEAQVRERAEKTAPDRGIGLFHANELGNLLATLDKQFNQGATEMLTEWYDCPPSYRDKKVTRGDYYVRQPFVTILAASTPAWLVSNRGKYEGGFFPRWLFFTAPPQKDYDLAFPDHGDGDLRNSVLAHMDVMTRPEGQMSLTPEGLDAYESWYDHALDGVKPYLQPWVDRMRTAALKIAMLYEVTTGEQVGPVGAANVVLATRVIDRMAHDLNTLVEFDLAFTEEDAEMKRVKKAIFGTGAGGIPRGALLRLLSPMKAKELDVIITTLHQQGVIDVQHSQSETKPGIRYVRV
jgi:hypothetical protein